MQNNATTYSFTLYGGLGQFFYNLTYGSENDNVKKTLADLMLIPRTEDRRFPLILPSIRMLYIVLGPSYADTTSRRTKSSR